MGLRTGASAAPAPSNHQEHEEYEARETGDGVAPVRDPVGRELEARGLAAPTDAPPVRVPVDGNGRAQRATAAEGAPAAVVALAEHEPRRTPDRQSRALHAPALHRAGGEH